MDYKIEEDNFERIMKLLKVEKEIIEERKRAKVAVIDEKTKKEKSLLEKKMDKAIVEMQEQAKIDQQKRDDEESKSGIFF